MLVLVLFMSDDSANFTYFSLLPFSLFNSSLIKIVAILANRTSRDTNKMAFSDPCYLLFGVNLIIENKVIVNVHAPTFEKQSSMPFDKTG